jgi:hypothetical protein
LRDLEKRRIELDGVVQLAQRHLGPDVAFIAELTPDGLVYRAVAGDAASFNIALDGDPLKEATYAQRLVDQQAA